MPAIFNVASVAYDFETITVSTVSIGCTASKIAVTTALGKGHPTAMHPSTKYADQAFFTVEDQPIYYRFDGTAPTSTIGHLGAVGSSIEIEGYGNIAKFRAIAQGSDAKLRVTYLSRG